MELFIKDPDAKLDYGFDWTNWLADGETVITSNWTVPVGITKESEANDGYQTVAWLSGGTLETEYTVTNSIVTSAGREEDRSFRVKIVSR